ncbi:MAG TPA: TIGR03435 family protein [Bryobacteraceae bacterium]
MWIYFSLVALIAALPPRAAAQQAQPLAFEVASVRQAPNSAPLTPEDIRAGRNVPRMSIEGDRVDITNMPMRTILGIAYGVMPIYIFGESWLEGVRWDIQAKMPAAATREQVPGPLRALLEERFALRAHSEMRDMPIYALVEAKGGIRLQGLPPDAPISSKTDPASGKMEMVGTLDTIIGLTGGAARLNAPVENHTGLSGKYKVSLDTRLVFAWAQQMKPGDSVTPGPDDSDAVDRMSEILAPMGLKLERRKVPKEVVVIDHMNRTPTEN